MKVQKIMERVIETSEVVCGWVDIFSSHGAEMIEKKRVRAGGK